MVKDNICFAYASRVLEGTSPQDRLFPDIWWDNVDPDASHLIAITIGVIIDKMNIVDVRMEITHESSDESCIGDDNFRQPQQNYLVAYPENRQEFIGLSSLYVGSVSLRKTGVYTVTVSLIHHDATLHEVETQFFVSSLKGMS